MPLLRARRDHHRGIGDGAKNDVRFDVSADGGTVVFTTAQALLPNAADVNGVADVYEWHNGVLRLITDGETRFKSGEAQPALVGIDPSARDVFFTVAQPGLTGFEQDGLVNIYDARVGGGFIPPSPFEPCEVLADTCQGPLPASPFAALPSSALVFGGGNVSAPSKPAAVEAEGVDARAEARGGAEGVP